MGVDNWKHRNANMKCRTCMYFVEKTADTRQASDDRGGLGRCRRNAPTMKGWPALFDNDWCGEHKIDENKWPERERGVSI